MFWYAGITLIVLYKQTLKMMYFISKKIIA